MTAFIPVRKRDRELALSHAVSGTGVSFMGVASTRGVVVRDGRGAVASASVAVGEGTAVADGDSMSSVGDENGRGVAVSDGEVDEIVIVAGSAPSVAEALEGMISVVGTSVDTGDTG
jgi:hypothetical protein